MKRILITGATGNVGMAVIKALTENKVPLTIMAGVRDLEADKKKLDAYQVSLVKFDFMDSATYDDALNDCDLLFLMRPPPISNTKKYFFPLIESAKKSKIKHIVFLSVQGVEKSSLIPHNQIEKMIEDSKIPYTFLRPAYFMQNFVMSLHEDLVMKKRIFLPAGNARFTLIDVQDIGNVASTILSNVSIYINTKYELTSTEKPTFPEMAIKLSKGLGIKINYLSPNLLRFILTKRKEKMPFALILVMIMLHYLPRFQKDPTNTNWVQTITGHPPISFEQFIQSNRISLLS